MIYLSSIDTTNMSKMTDYIFSLMDKIVKEVGEENIVQVVTNNEASCETPRKSNFFKNDKMVISVKI